MSSGRHFRRGMVGTASLVLLLCSVAGCVYIPTPDRQAVGGTEVTEEDLAFLETAVTTRAEVTERFGQPTFLWRDENIFVYRWVKQRGVMLWAVAAGTAATFGAFDVSQEFAFLLKFDPNGRFVSSEIVEKPATQNYGDFLLEWRDAQRARDWKPGEADP